MQAEDKNWNYNPLDTGNNSLLHNKMQIIEAIHWFQKLYKQKFQQFIMVADWMRSKHQPISSLDISQVVP